MNKNRIRLTESQLHRIIKESVKNVLTEIGNSARGQFAINAVRGRAAARPRYQNTQYGGVKKRAQQNAIVDIAGDTAYYARKMVDPYFQNREMDDYANAGYNYGYQKGMTN